MPKKYKPFKRLQKYYEQLKPHSGIEVYEHDIAMNAADCLDSSDWFCELQGYTAQACRDRYEFRDGAAIMLASVYGLDISAARAIMQTHQAWADYEKAKEKEDAEKDSGHVVPCEF